MFDPVSLIVYLLACYRITRLVVADTFPFEPFRRWVVRRWPGPDDRFGEGEVEFRRNQNGQVVAAHVAGHPKVELTRVDGWYYALFPRRAGELIQCPWCVGVYVSAALFAWWQWGNGDPVAWVFGIAAGSAAAGLFARWAE